MLTTRYHLDEAHLRHYDERLKSWANSQPVKTITFSLYPWVLTEKAGAVTSWPVGGTPLKPTVDFLFSETGPASGDKSPSNPSTIVGVSEIVVGLATKNVLSLQLQRSSGANFTFQKYADGSFRITGTTLATSVEELVNLLPRGTGYPAFAPGEKYTVSFYSDSNLLSVQAYCRVPSGSYVGLLPGNIYNGNSATMTIPSYVSATNDLWLRVKINNNYTAVDINALCKVQIELGETATNFVPALPSFDETHIPLGSTYYGGTLDVASGVMTVTWYGKILDGTETELSLMSPTTDARLAYNILGAGLPASVGGYPASICSHSSIYNPANAGVWGEFCIRNSGYFMMQDKNHVIGTTIDAYRTWLSTQYANGTPVTFAYKVATPFTVQLTPTEILSLAQTDKYTPRLNTLYTDAQAVQIGYVKSPIREEFELQQAIVGQGGNI